MFVFKIIWPWVKVFKCVCMLPGRDGRVFRGRGLSRGSLPVRNTGEMGAGPVSSDGLFCGTPAWESVTDEQHGDVRNLVSLHDLMVVLLLYHFKSSLETWRRAWSLEPSTSLITYTVVLPKTCKRTSVCAVGGVSFETIPANGTQITFWIQIMFCSCSQLTA